MDHEAALGRVSEGIDGLLEVDAAALSDDELSAAVVEAQRESERLVAARAALVSQWDTRQSWAADGAKTGAAWLAAKCRMSKASARREVRRALRHMPVASAALAAGEIGRPPRRPRPGAPRPPYRVLRPLRTPARGPRQTAAVPLWATGISTGKHPAELVREQLGEAGVLSVAEARQVVHGSLVDVGGSVTHRQRPATARGVVFVNLEDETGMLNVIVEPGVWRRFRKVARTSDGLVVRGVVERHQGVVNLIARRISPLAGAVAALPARNFR